jgi:ribosomal protein S18 acetylase RimI-like enzyme
MNLTFRTKLAADQIDAAVKIARSHAKSLGFVTSAFYEKQAAKDELLVALAVVRAVAGFCLFHIRRDGVLVIYEIATEKDHLGQGIGRALIEELKRIGRARGAYSISALRLVRNAA